MGCKAKTPVGVPYAAVVTSEKAMAGEIQAAGDGVSKFDLEGARDPR